MCLGFRFVTMWHLAITILLLFFCGPAHVWCLSPHYNRLPTAILPQCAAPVLCVFCAGPTASLSCFCDCTSVLYARVSFAAGTRLFVRHCGYYYLCVVVHIYMGQELCVG